MEDKIKLLKYRELKKYYSIIYVVKNEITMNSDDKIILKDIYTLIGIDMLGFPSVLDIIINDESNNRFWLDVFNNLKGRGINRIFFISIISNKKVQNALNLTFPNTITVISLINIINNIYKFISIRSKNTFIKQIKNLCIQPSIEQFQYEVNLFKEHYANNYIIDKLMNNKIEEIEITYEYDKNVRKLLFYHNKCLNLYDKIKKGKEVIQNIDEIWEMLYDYIIKFELNKSFYKNEWSSILNSLTIKFDEEIIKAIQE